MIDEKLIARLQKVLALTTSPMEGEAQAASLMLKELLAKHNLDIADLERRGEKVAQGVKEDGYDLGKAAFTWKLDLAEAVAKHYFCYPMVDRKKKTVAFIGRPDNTESLRMLYTWLIDQIKRISADERRAHLSRTGEHIDPLRWQVQFGIGAAARLGDRLEEQKRKEAANNEIQALVVHHEVEISDYLEEKYGYRRDGRMTKQEQYWHEKQQEWSRKWKQEREEKAELLRTDPAEYYRRYPNETPEAKAKQAAEDAKWYAEQEKKARARARARERRDYTYRYEKPMTAEEIRKANQGYTAKSAGERAAEKINLQPFITGKEETPKKRIG